MQVFYCFVFCFVDLLEFVGFLFVLYLLLGVFKVFFLHFFYASLVLTWLRLFSIFFFSFVASTQSCISASLTSLQLLLHHGFSCIVASPTSLLFLSSIEVASRSQFLLLAIALASQLFLLSAIYFYHHVSFFFLFHIVRVVYFFVYLVCASFFLFFVFGFHCETHYAQINWSSSSLV